jgi:dTDP-4-amino-4,6-dideoxygalactose transaminase
MYPHSEAAGDTLLTLPFHAKMTDEQVDFVCAAVTEEASARTVPSTRCARSGQ